MKKMTRMVEENDAVTTTYKNV